METLVILDYSEHARLLEIEKAYNILCNGTTEKQNKYLSYFKKFKEEHGFYPTYKIAAKALGKHQSVIHSAIKKIKLKGLLK